MVPLDAARAFFQAHPDTDPTPCLCERGPDDRVIATKDRFGLPLRLVLCRACGLIRQDPQPSAATLAAFYDGPYAALHHGHLSMADMEWKASRVSSFVGRRPVGLVVDVGCAAGWSLLGFPHRRIGYDTDEAMLERGRALGLDLRRGGVQEAVQDLSGTPADLVIYSHVLEHTKDPVTALRDLRPLGHRLYLEVPHISAIPRRFKGDTSRYWQRAHLWEFQPDHLRAILRRAGWAAEEVSTVNAVTQILAVPAEVAHEEIPDLARHVDGSLREFEARWKRNPRRVVRRLAEGFRQVVRGVRGLRVPSGR